MEFPQPGDDFLGCGVLKSMDACSGLVEQKEDNWCWAACAVMILKCLGQEKLRCEVAKILFPSAGCCHDPVPDECDKPTDIAGLERIFADCLVGYDFKDCVLQFGELVDALRNGPVLIGSERLGSSGHLVLVMKGYGDGEFLVFDPLGSKRVATYSDISEDVLGGDWFSTWFNFRELTP